MLKHGAYETNDAQKGKVVECGQHGMKQRYETMEKWPSMEGSHCARSVALRAQSHHLLAAVPASSPLAGAGGEVQQI
jgi:hypothetical protein